MRSASRSRLTVRPGGFLPRNTALRIDVVVAVSSAPWNSSNGTAPALAGRKAVFSGLPGGGLQPVGLPPNPAAVVNDLDVGRTIDLARRLQPECAPYSRGIRCVGSGQRNEHLRERSCQRDRHVPWSSSQACRCRNWSPGSLRSPRTRSFSISHSFATGTADPIRRAKSCALSVPIRARPCTARPKRTLDSASRPAAWNRIRTRQVLGSSFESCSRAGADIRPSLAGNAQPMCCRRSCAAALAAGRAASADGCEIRFADQTSWRQYGWQIVVLAVIAGQMMLIVTCLSSAGGAASRSGVAEALSEMAHMNRRVALGEGPHRLPMS